MIEKDTYETIREKLLEVSPPDMDSAWTKMDHLLNEVPLAPSESILKHLLRTPKIWLNSLFLLVASAALSGAYFAGDKDAATHSPAHTSIAHSIVQQVPIYPSENKPVEIVETLEYSPSVNVDLNSIPKSFSIPDLATLDLFYFKPIISSSFENNSMKDKCVTDMAWSLPMIKTWGVSLSLGAFPEVTSLDLLGQVGAGIWTKRMKYGLGLAASFGYNPVSIRSFNRIFEKGVEGSSFYQRDSSDVSRLNYLSTTLGLVKKVNPRLEIECGMQLSKLVGLFENQTTELEIDGTTTRLVSKNKTTNDFRGIRPYDVGLYFGTSFGKGALKVDVVYRQSLRDFTLNDVMKNPAFNTHSNFRFGLSYMLGYKQ